MYDISYDTFCTCMICLRATGCIICLRVTGSIICLRATGLIFCAYKLSDDFISLF